MLLDLQTRNLISSMKREYLVYLGNKTTICGTWTSTERREKSPERDRPRYKWKMRERGTNLAGKSQISLLDQTF
jgi:hypothetical protein